MELALSSSRFDDVTVVRVAGEVDVYSAPALKDRLEESVAEPPHRVVVDLADVTFLDSTGLGTLVGALKAAEKLGGTVSITGAHERVLKLFRITGLDEVFTVSEAAAGQADDGTRRANSGA